MPTYSYRCANCDVAFDQYQAFADDSLTVCPNCGQSQLRKVFNSIGVSFTGSGFYRNDSRAEKSKSSAGSSSSSGDSASKSDAKSDTKSDTKPASKPASGGSSDSGGSTTSAPSTPASKPAA